MAVVAVDAVVTASVEQTVVPWTSFDWTTSSAAISAARPVRVSIHDRPESVSAVRPRVVEVGSAAAGTNWPQPNGAVPVFRTRSCKVSNADVAAADVAAAAVEVADADDRGNKELQRLRRQFC